MGLDFSLGVDLRNGPYVYSRTYRMIVPNELMLIDGSVFNDRDGDGACFLPYRRNPDKNGPWIFGSMVMNLYYLVFDASDPGNLRMGIGARSNGISVDPGPTNDKVDSNPVKRLTIGLIFSTLIVCGAVLFYNRSKNKNKYDAGDRNSLLEKH